MEVHRKNRTSKSDLGLGLSSLISRSIQTGKNVLLLASLVWVPVFIFIVALFMKMNTTPNERYMLVKYVQARALAHELPLGHYQVEFQWDKKYVLTAKQLYGWPPLKESAESTWQKIRPHLENYAGIAFFVTWLVSMVIGAIGKRLRGDHRLRGGRLVHWKKLRRELRKRRIGSKKFCVGQCPIIENSETENILTLGSPGTGKTTFILEWLDQLERLIPAIVYDTKGDLLAMHGDVGRDVVMNPAHPSFPRWCVWNEIRNRLDASLVAEAWLPDSKSSDRFWDNSARQLLADILVAVPLEKRTNGELVRVCLHASSDELRELLRDFPSGGLFADPENARMRESVRNTLRLNLQGLLFLDPAVKAGEGFSIRSWLSEVTSNGYGDRLFVGCPPSHASALAPLIGVFLEIISASLLDLGPDDSRRVAIVVDEFPTLPPLKFLKRVMSEGRGYGAMVLLAAQNHTQIRETYGENAASTICSVCSTHVVFRVNDPDAADRASKLLGEAEFDDVRETDGNSRISGNTSLSSQRATRRVVLASEVASLPKFHAFLKLAGDVPVAEISVKPKKRKKVVPDFEPRLPEGYTPPKPDVSIDENHDDKGLL